MDLASHFNRVVKSVDRITAMVLASVSLQLALVNAVPWHVRTGKQVVVTVLATDAASLFASFQRSQVLIAGSRVLLPLQTRIVCCGQVSCATHTIRVVSIKLVFTLLRTILRVYRERLL